MGATLTFLGSRERQQESKQDELDVVYFTESLSPAFSASQVYCRVCLRCNCKRTFSDADESANDKRDRE